MRWRKGSSFNSETDRLTDTNMAGLPATMQQMPSCKWSCGNEDLDSRTAVQYPEIRHQHASALPLGILENAHCTKLLSMLAGGGWGLLFCFGFNSNFFSPECNAGTAHAASWIYGCQWDSWKAFQLKTYSSANDGVQFVLWKTAR